MIPLTLGEIAEATGGRLHRAAGTELVTGSVEFDSRQLGAGGLFVAVPGERVDGHDFAERAVAAGAVGVLAGREVPVPAVLVPRVEGGHTDAHALAGDTDGSGAAVLAGLAALARTVAARLIPAGLSVVGITGTSGKTSTKDLVAQLLEPMGPTVAPPGSFNNELGHPWTVLRADTTTRHLVLELAMRGRGHIAALCATAPPRIGVVLNIGTAHLVELGSQEAIAEAKAELVEALPPDGVAVLNVDDPRVAPMASRTRARVVRFGTSADADVRAVDVELDDQARASFRLVSPAGEAMVRLAVHGSHNIGNALAAAAVALELGAGVDDVAARLSAARRRAARRMEVSTTDAGVTVVNDAYNANQESMNAALHTLATMSGGRRWAVLGTIGGLGDETTRVHEEVGRLATQLRIDRIVAVNETAGGIQRGATLERWPGDREREEPVLVPDVDSAIALLDAEVRPGDVVLVKASNVVGLWRVADALLGSRA